MRMWHKGWISALPKQQLLVQWKDCCCISKELATKGELTDNFLRKILEYPVGHFQTYCELILIEMSQRGCEVSKKTYDNLCRNISIISGRRICKDQSPMKLFEGWHDDTYFWHDYSDLNNEYISAKIVKEEWQKIHSVAELKREYEVMYEGRYIDGKR